MKKKTLLRIIAPSLLAIAVSGTIVAGSTYALFTSDDNVNIAISSGKVNVSATIDDITLFSAFPSNWDTAGYNFEMIDSTTKYTQLDENGQIYYSRVLDGSTFETGGTVNYANGIMSISNAVPGDKAEFTVNVSNTSNVDIKYRLIVECIDTQEENLRLFSNLLFKYGSQDLTKVKRYATSWITKDAGEPIASENVSLKLPLTATNRLQEHECNIRIFLEAVQKNALVVNKPESLTVDFDDVVVEADNTGLNDVTLNAGTAIDDSTQQERSLVTVVVPLSTNQIMAKVENDDVPVVVDDTLNLKVEQKSDIEEAVIVVPSETEVMSFDVSLVNQDGKKILSTSENIEVQLYVGLGKAIQNVYHNGEPVSNYTYENGIITIYTDSFSEYAVTYYVPENLQGHCRVGDTFYETVKQGVAALQDGQKLTIFKSTTENCSNTDCFNIHATNVEIEILDGVTLTTAASPQAFLISGLNTANVTFSGRGTYDFSTFSTNFINQGSGVGGASNASSNVTLKDITINCSGSNGSAHIFGMSGSCNAPTATIQSGNYKNLKISEQIHNTIYGGQFTYEDCASYLANGKAATQLDGTDGYLYKIENLNQNNAGCVISYEEQQQPDSVSDNPYKLVASKLGNSPVVEPVVVSEGNTVKKYYSTLKKGLANLDNNQEIALLRNANISNELIQEKENITIKLKGFSIIDTVDGNGTTSGSDSFGNIYNATLAFKNVTGLIIDGEGANNAKGSIEAKCTNKGNPLCFMGGVTGSVRNINIIADIPQSQLLSFVGTNEVAFTNNYMSVSNVGSSLCGTVPSTTTVQINSGTIANHVDEALAYIKADGMEASVDADGQLIVEPHTGVDYDAKVVNADDEDRLFFTGNGASNNAVLNAKNGEKVYIKENVNVTKTLTPGFKFYIIDESESGASWNESGVKAVDGYKVNISYDETTKTYTYECVEIKVAKLVHSGETTYYKTLKDAVTASVSNAGDVITMIDDCIISKGFTIDKAITIDLNGKNITVNSGGLTSHTSSKLTTIKDTSATGTGTIHALKGCPIIKGASSGAKGQLYIYSGNFVSDSTYALDVTIGVCAVYGGRFVGKSGTDAINAGWSINATYYFQIQGGTYSSDISTISKTGFSITKSVVDNGDGTWTVK